MALTPELELELRDAKERAGSFLGAAKVAAFNGWWSDSSPSCRSCSVSSA